MNWYIKIAVRLTLCAALMCGSWSSNFAQDMLPEPKLEFIFEAKVTIDPALELGITTYGKRRIINITGGSFEGPNIKGRVLPGGADWQTVRTDGTADLEARYTLQTDDGVLIYIQNRGVRHASPEVLQQLGRGERVDPTQYYMRTAAVFEVADGTYAWLKKSIIISTGERMADHVRLRFYKVL